MLIDLKLHVLVHRRLLNFVYAERCDINDKNIYQDCQRYMNTHELYQKGQYVCNTLHLSYCFDTYYGEKFSPLISELKIIFHN